MDKFEGITWPDYLVIAIYFLFVLGVGLFVSSYIFMLIHKKLQKFCIPFEIVNRYHGKAPNTQQVATFWHQEKCILCL